ncbi:MAG: DUF4065 domain-containing protein [Bacteroidota bacterium]|nr:DUF4065 domain-containing protein [Bacteroidota bacterium]MDE2955754.1 DUF4065 domain-containing protein [Bacteroidota bacterium]
MAEALERQANIASSLDFVNRENDPCTSEEVVALFMLERALSNDRRRLSPLELNKLVFIAHGWTLGALDRPLIDNRVNQIQARPIGPVVVSLHLMLKKWGAESLNLYDFYSLLSRSSSRLNPNLLPLPGDARPLGLVRLDDDSRVCDVLNLIYDTYTRYNGGQLVTLTTQADSPWASHYGSSFLGRWGLWRGVGHIPDISIRAYYRRRLGK